MTFDMKNEHWFDSWSKEIKNTIKSYGEEGLLSDFLVHQDRYREIANIILKSSSSKSRILDIGVSKGYTCKLLQFLDRNDFNGLDLDSESCFFPEIKDKIIEFDLENIPGSRLPIDDEKYDIIIMTEVFEHLHPYKTLDIMKEIKRILVPGGTIIFSTPNLASFENRMALLLGGVEKHRSGTIIDGCHTREYTMKELNLFFRKLDFEVMESYFQSPRQFIILNNKGQVIEKSFIKGLIRYPNLKNYSRMIAGVLKYISPSFRETIFFILKKASRKYN